MKETTELPTQVRRENIRNVWERWAWVWHVVSYFFLISNIVMVFLFSDEAGTSLGGFFSALALFALWYTVSIWTPDTFWKRYLPYNMLYFVVGWGVWVVLILLDPSSMMLAAVLFLMAFTRLPIRWAIGSSVVTVTILVVLNAIWLGPEALPALLFAGTLYALSTSLLGLYIGSLIQQSEERRRLADELRETQRDLLLAERRAGVLTERQRLAHEIHDTLTQDFTCIAMHLDAAKLGLENDPAGARQYIDQAYRTAREGVSEARRLVWALHPEKLGQISLDESIKHIAENWAETNGISTTTTVTGIPRPLQPEIEATVLRATQEALHNVQKHAGASNVAITLSYMLDMVILDVHDDGIGFDVGRFSRSQIWQFRDRFGLRLMQDRVEKLGGMLAVESQPGEGTTLAISLPLLTDSIVKREESLQETVS